MASKIDMSLDDIARQQRFSGQGRFNRSASGAVGKFSSQDRTGDLRSVLAKKQIANVSDLRSKLKPKALYTGKRTMSKPSVPYPAVPYPTAPMSVNGSSDREGRKKLKLTSSFKNSVSSAVAGSNASEEKSSRQRSQRNEPSTSSGTQRRSSIPKIPSYEEAKKISVTVPGLSKPVSEVRYLGIQWFFVIPLGPRVEKACCGARSMYNKCVGKFLTQLIVTIS